MNKLLKVQELLTKASKVGDCLECHLQPNAKGYSPVGLGGRSGIKYRAHRLVWEVMKGPIPQDKFVCHSCDNRRCINVDHLFIGSPKDNTQDMMKKARHKYITHPKITTKEQVKTIRHLRATGHTLYQIATLFGISIETVRIYAKSEFRQEELV